MHPIHALGATAILVLAAAPAARAGTIRSTPWGTTPDGQAVTLYSLTNDHGMTVKVMTYGADITEIDTPDIHGHSGDIVLGFPTLEGYVAKNANIHFGAAIGRYANRIARAQFTLDGKVYHLQPNDHGNTLHGGTPGYDRVVWTGAAGKTGGNEVSVTMRRTSPDGEQGFPGKLDIAITYTLTEDSLRIDYAARTDHDTVVNFTNHSYFNLNGSGTAMETRLRIDASRFTPTDPHQIPTGQLAAVAGTPLDFRKMFPLGPRVRSADPQMVYAIGYDQNWVLDKAPGTLGFAARAWDPRSGREVDVSTTEPGLQVYTANSLDGSVVGTAGVTYRQGDAFTLETQHFPDSPNEPGFPSTEVKPGAPFHSTTIFRFSTSVQPPQ